MYNLTISEFNKAKDGSLFIKKNGKLVAITKEEFLKDLGPIKTNIQNLQTDQKAINEMIKFFDLYSKPHFQVVFDTFRTNVLCGFIDAGGEDILKLDEEVAKGTISVMDALKRHPFLEERFNQLFVDNKKELKGFWEV